MFLKCNCSLSYRVNSTQQTYILRKYRIFYVHSGIQNKLIIDISWIKNTLKFICSTVGKVSLDRKISPTSFIRLKGPVENPTRPSITGGSIEITPTVPLTVVFIRGAVTEKYKNVRYKILFWKNRPTFALYRIIGKKSKFQLRFLNIMLFNFSF